MYPISRPTASNSTNTCHQQQGYPPQNDAINNNPYTFQMNSNSGSGGTLPRNYKPHLAYTDTEPNQQIIYNNTMNPITPNIQQIRQKRVQFANIPPSPANPIVVPSQSSHRSMAQDFLNNNNNNNQRHGHHMPRRDRHRSSSQQQQQHHSSSMSLSTQHRSNKPHRRSSSTSNFNTSTMSSKSHQRQHRHSHRSSKSNRSLIVGSSAALDYNDNGFNSACEFEYENEDEYQNACSTCSSTISSNTTTSTSSTDSDSDFDDFGCDPLETYSKMYYQKNTSLRMNAASHSVSCDQSSQMPTNNNNNNNNGTSTRRYNSGLKISYVDNLPLARTNPAPSTSTTSNGHHKKSSKSNSTRSTSSVTSASGGAGTSKKKAISKFKKDNCVIS